MPECEEGGQIGHKVKSSQSDRGKALKTFFFSFFLFRAALWHMEVPRLGVELELQLPAYTIATAM